MARNEQQFKLHAYVCGNACLKLYDGEGTLTFTQVFVKRPSDCRYAVASYYDVAARGDVVLVWDLYSAGLTRTDALVPPDPLYRGDCVDAAIMQTFMTYEDS
jgi:hypothetical protein